MYLERTHRLVYGVPSGWSIWLTNLPRVSEVAFVFHYREKKDVLMAVGEGSGIFGRRG